MNQARSSSILHGPLLRVLLVLLLPALAGACSPDVAATAGAAPEQGPSVDEHDEQTATDATHVTLTETGAANAGVEVVEVVSEPKALATPALEVPARVEFRPDRVALVSPRTSGRLERLTGVAGDRVAAGEPVAYVLSPAFLTAQDDFVYAARRANLLAGSPDEEGARAMLSAAERRLELLGASAELIAGLRAGGEPIDLLPIVAPFDGSLVEARALAGAAVESGTPLFKIADLSVLDIVADVPEQALPSMTLGRPATVHLLAYPGRSFSGRVERLHDELDLETRTVHAVIRLPNPERILRPGMFASVTLAPIEARPGDGADMVPVVPASAIVTDGPESFVFVEVGPLTFERRSVDATPIGDGSRLAVLAGVVAGERIVSKGAFALKSELGKAGFGEHDH